MRVPLDGMAGWQDLESFEIPLSITFDDGNKIQYAKFYPSLDEHKIRATFYIITSRIGRPGKIDWDELRDLYDSDNEIGSHTHTHPHLTELSDIELDFELKKTRALLSPFKCRTLAYPFGEYDERVIDYARRYYAAARGYYDTQHKSKDYGYNFGSTHEIYKLRVFPMDNVFPLQSIPISKFQKLVAKIISDALQAKAWAVFVFHGPQRRTPGKIAYNLSKQLRARDTLKSIINFFDLTSFIHSREEIRKFRWMCEYLAANDQTRILTVSEVVEYLLSHHQLPPDVCQRG